MTQTQLVQLQNTMTKACNDYGQSLHSHAFFRINDHTKSNDMVQDTFLKTWSYLYKGGKIDLMKSFLYRVLSNRIVDEYRKHKTASLDEMLENGYEPKDTYTERNSDIFDGKRVLRLIRHLPLSYRKILRMKFIKDLSLQEISSITGKSKNSISVKIHRGLERLRLLENSRLSIYKRGRNGTLLTD